MASPSIFDLIQAEVDRSKRNHERCLAALDVLKMAATTLVAAHEGIAATNEATEAFLDAIDRAGIGAKPPEAPAPALTTDSLVARMAAAPTGG